MQKELTPIKIIEFLDRYIIGQKNAKKSLAIALRNRWRRQQLSKEFRDEVTPKNILMIGATGVGKTEIARRISTLVKAPFIKVEASKFTEVGYVGRDVESIIRDLMEISISMVRKEKKYSLRSRARKLALEKTVDVLFPDSSSEKNSTSRQNFLDKINSGEMDERIIEIEIVETTTPIDVFAASNEHSNIDFKEIFSNMLPRKTKKKKMSVKEALIYFEEQALDKITDTVSIKEEAKNRLEQDGIVFIDEIDKVVGKDSSHRADISREGVQRDLLPIVEGSTVNTKYGPVNTDFILFIASGAFHLSKPSDIIPELQGRFPIRVELETLSKDDFIKILTEPRYALIKQYQELLKAEKCILKFQKNAIEIIAEFAFQVNSTTENIGARRLHTILEKIFEEISFNASECPEGHVFNIDKAYIVKRLGDIVTNQDLSRYIL